MRAWERYRAMGGAENFRVAAELLLQGPSFGAGGVVVAGAMEDSCRLKLKDGEEELSIQSWEVNSRDGVVDELLDVAGKRND